MNLFVFRKHRVPVQASAAGLEENLAAEIDAAMAAMDAATISLDDETPGSDGLPEHEIETRPFNNIQNNTEADILGSASNADSILQQAVWSLVLQLQGSHRDGVEEAKAEVEVEVEAGKALRSRDLVNCGTEDLAVCAVRMDYIMVDYISNGWTWPQVSNQLLH